MDQYVIFLLVFAVGFIATRAFSSYMNRVRAARFLHDRGFTQQESEIVFVEAAEEAGWLFFFNNMPPMVAMEGTTAYVFDSEGRELIFDGVVLREEIVIFEDRNE